MARIWIRTLSIVVAAVAATSMVPVRGDDESDYVWQSDGDVRPVGVIQPDAPKNLTTALIAEARFGPTARQTASGLPKGFAVQEQTSSAAGTKRGNPFKEEAPPAKPPAAASAVPGTAAAVSSDACTVCEDDCDGEPYRLFKLPALEDSRIGLRGWLEQGYTWSPDRPANRFNGPVAFNDRSNEYQLNQLYLIAERVAKPGERTPELGGRVDFLYGTDHRFVTASGLDDDWSGSARFYGLAMPQLYGDLAFQKLLFRAGHFYAPCGYETAMVEDNFFYSHSYTFLYAQPTSLTGAQLQYQLNDRLSVNGGLDTGWNAWEPTNGKLGYFTGVNWTSPDKRTSLAFELFLNNRQPAGIESTLTHYALVLRSKLSDKLSYGFEHNLGYDPEAVQTQFGRTHGEWYSFVHYLIYELNPCWSVGVRYEWLNDDDGLVVQGLGDPHGIPLSPVPAAWNELSLGVNYKPSNNLVLRSEVRWDWENTWVPAIAQPFDDFTKSRQFLWATDLIVRF